MPDPATTLGALCVVCQIRASTRRIPTEDGGKRWEIRAVTVTGGESWRIEADELMEAIVILAEQLGVRDPP